MVAPAVGPAEPAPRALAAHANVLLPGLYAWASTVLLPSLSPPASAVARFFAVATLVALGSGALLLRRFPRVGWAVGVHGFVGLAIVTWALLRQAGVVLGAQVLPAVFGAVGWALYAFGWGELSARRRVPEDDPFVLPGAPLSPRSRWSRSAELIVFLGAGGSALLLLLAFRVERPAQAVMAQALWLLVSLALIATATRVAVGRGPRQLGGGGERLSRASSSLALLLILLGLGFLYWIMER
jgi:hypothetical protein